LDWSGTNYAGDGAIYCSADAGVTWTRTGAPSNAWSSVASSADGTKLAALTLSYWSGGAGAGEAYISTDSGATWALGGPLPAEEAWCALASSADGNNIVAVGHDLICTLRDPAPSPPPPSPPGLQIERLGTDFRLSWLVSSTSFVLQQSPHLHAPGWSDVTTPATLDFTNLHYVVTLPPSLDNRFYRLKQQ